MSSNLFTKAFLIICFFSIIGVFLGYLKPIKTPVQFVDMNQEYRENVLTIVDSDNPTITSGTLLPNNDKTVNTKPKETKSSSNFPSVSSLVDKTNHNVNFAIKEDTKTNKDGSFSADSIPSTEDVSEKILAEERKKQEMKSNGVWGYLKNIFGIGNKKIKNQPQVGNKSTPIEMEDEYPKKEEKNEVETNPKDIKNIPKVPVGQVDISLDKGDESHNNQSPKDQSGTKKKQKDISGNDQIKIPSVEFLSKEILDLDKKNS